MASNVNIDEFLLSGDGSSRASVEKRCSLTLLRMLEEGLHADITISAEGGSVKAHRCVLASVSPVFNAMFEHQMREQLTSTVELPEMSIQGLQLFLVLIYLLPNHDDTVEMPDLIYFLGGHDGTVLAMPEFATASWRKHFDELIEACCKYQVKRLAPVLTFHLTSVLNPERCWDYLRKSEPLSSLCGILDYEASKAGPYAVCRAYIFLNFHKVIEAESFILEMQNDPVKVNFYLRAYIAAILKHSQREKPSEQRLKTAKTLLGLN
jgi:hypothetical protein